MNSAIKSNSSTTSVPSTTSGTSVKSAVGGFRRNNRPSQSGKNGRRVMKERRPRANFSTLKGNFKLYDDHKGLKLYSEPHPTGLKGVVFSGNTCVMNAFPRVSNVTQSTISSRFTDELVAKGRFFEHQEGALVRVYFAENDWRISTQRKIDAFMSRWSSRHSFGENWVEAIISEQVVNEKYASRVGEDGSPAGRLFKTLDVKNQYLFIVRNTRDNRIVCKAPERPTLYHIGTFKDGKLDIDDDIDVAKPTEHAFKSVEELERAVAALDCKIKSGFTAVLPNNKWYKIQSTDYINLETVRGNEPSLKFRYLQLRLEPEKVDALYELYPLHAHVFNEYEDTLFDIARHIHTAYVNRFIRREYVSLEREFFGVMRICHEWHKEDRQYNRVDLDKVIEVMNTRHDHVLNKMIRMFKKLKAEEGEQNGEGDKD